MSWMRVTATDGRHLGWVEVLFHPNPDASMTPAEEKEVDAMVDAMLAHGVEHAYSDEIPARLEMWRPGQE
jgi:hypothetical protein